MVKGLVDSGCTARAFISKELVLQYNIPMIQIPIRRTVLLADSISQGMITHYVILPTAVGEHQEWCLFFITRLSADTPVIFGMPWLKRHNP